MIMPVPLSQQLLDFILLQKRKGKIDTTCPKLYLGEILGTIGSNGSKRRRADRFLKRLDEGLDTTQERQKIADAFGYDSFDYMLLDSLDQRSEGECSPLIQGKNSHIILSQSEDDLEKIIFYLRKLSESDYEKVISCSEILRNDPEKASDMKKG